jgi:hypothetical protein
MTTAEEFSCVACILVPREGEKVCFNSVHTDGCRELARLVAARDVALIAKARAEEQERFLALLEQQAVHHDEWERLCMKEWDLHGAAKSMYTAQLLRRLIADERAAAERAKGE